MDKELDERAAKCMGFTHVVRRRGISAGDDVFVQLSAFSECVFSPSTDYNQAMMLRDKAAEVDKYPFARGTKFRNALSFDDEIADAAQDDEPITEKIIATAAQITRAAVRVLEAMEAGEGG